MKIYFETYGCSHNKSDTEWMKKNLYQTTESIDKSDVIVLNTCAVKNKTILNLKKRLNELKIKYPDKKIVLAGCFPMASSHTNFKEFPEITNYPLISPHTMNKLDLAIKNNSKFLGKKEWNPDLIITGEKVCVIPISTGCLNECSFCQTKLARGNLKSYSIKEICDAIKNNYEKGSKIFYLASQDNGCYGFDIKTNLVELLKEINKIPKDFIVRVGMANPQYVIKYINDLIKEMKSDKFFEFLHIPVQSGSNKVLKEMKRGHSAEDYLMIAEIAKKNNFSLATDIIVGYPTETAEDFNKTVEIIMNSKPDVINRAKFSARPGTFAFNLKKINGNEMKKRSFEIDLLTKQISLENNKEWINCKVKCVVETIKKKGTVVCRNKKYKPIILKGNFDIGENLVLKISEYKTFHLLAKEIY